MTMKSNVSGMLGILCYYLGWKVWNELTIVCVLIGGVFTIIFVEGLKVNYLTEQKNGKED